MRLTYIS
jgi:hypothetical protein